MCVCVVSVIVKCPVLPPCAVDGCSRNPRYYYYFSLFADFFPQQFSADISFVLDESNFHSSLEKYAKFCYRKCCSTVGK